MQPFQICNCRRETHIRAVFIFCLSQLLVVAADSAHSATKQHSRRHSWILDSIFYDDGNHQSALGATRSLGSVGQVDDNDGRPQQADDLRGRRERQRNMSSHQAVSAYQSTSKDASKRLNRRHQDLMPQQHRQHYYQRLINTQQQLLRNRSILGETRKQRDLASSTSSFCSLLPQNPDLPRILRTLSQIGDTHLIEYSIEFPEYLTNPLRADGITISRPNATPTYVYDETKWQRVFTSQGKVLLTLGFNYDALSLGLLRYGVQKMTVPVLDNPPKCFAAQNASQRIALTLKLLLGDFDEDGGSGADVGSDKPPDIENDLWKHANNFVCHQVIQDGDRFAKFSHECCTIRRQHSREGRTECVISSSDNLVSLINILLASLAVLFFLFGPLLLQKLLFSGSTGRPEYVVPIEPHLWKTILIRRVPCEDGSSPAKRKEMRQFVRFRELVKSLKSEQVMRVVFSRLDILVDNRELMSEDEVPVGLLRFLLDVFVRCKITRVEPFRTCCAESVMGSWSPFFLWFRLKRHASDCNRGCKEICAWTSIFRCLGGLLLMVILLLPCYVRLVAFYWFEKEETEARSEARSQLGLRYRPGGIDLFQWLTSGHFLVVSIHVAFYVSYLLLFLVRAANASKVDDVIIRSVTDMRKLRRKECLRMLCAHLVLPFEKFGLCGVLVAALYWPLALPFCLLVTLTYCVPTLYLVGRLLVPSRPRCLGTRPFPSPNSESDPTNGSTSPLLSEGTTSFSSCLLLDRISVDQSPSAKDNLAIPTTRHPPRPSRSPSRESVAIAVASTLVALCLIVCMLSLLAMYSETCVFLVEIGFFATLGAIVNAKHSICDVILVFWACVYVIVPYRAVYARYAELSRCIFRFLKASLGERIESTSQLRHEKQKNTAFRFLDAANRGSTDFHQNARQPRATGSSREEETHVKTTEAEKDSIRTPADRTETAATDTDETIEYLDDRLHWKVRSLVMFVDRKDKPRIPRNLFWRICELNVTGSPGPVRRAMVVATGQVLASLFFLILLYVVVRVSAEMQPSSGVLQGLIVFSVGSVPIVAFVFIQGRWKHRLNEYSLSGNIRKTILEQYEHAWPVQDLRFSHLKDTEETKDNEPLLAESCPPHEVRCQRSGVRGRASYDPSQVDLLITIREEDESRQEDEGCLRSPASSGSPTSDVFRSPAEDFTREGVPLRLLGNRVTRCTSDPTAESHHPNALVPGLSCDDISAQRKGPVDIEEAL